jgi:hypothetical protein
MRIASTPGTSAPPTCTAVAAPASVPVPAASITSHNGIFTVKSASSGEHRTFRVKTQKPDATFAPGERIVSLLSGPNNGADYRSFGILKADGRIIVWKKHRGTQIEKLARMLERLDAHAAAGQVTVQAETRCRCCNRRLTTPTSISRGTGDICHERHTAGL